MSQDNKPRPAELGEVELSALEPLHAARLAQLHHDNYDELRRINPTPAVRPSVEQARSGIVKSINERREYRVAFVILAQGEVAGQVTLSQIVRYPLECANVGIFLAPAYRGRGVAGQAIAQICQHAFSELALHRLEAGIQPSNSASIKLFERSGFKRIGLVEQMLLVDGEWRDHLLFHKLAPEGSAGRK